MGTVLAEMSSWRINKYNFFCFPFHMLHVKMRSIFKQRHAVSITHSVCQYLINSLIIFRRKYEFFLDFFRGKYSLQKLHMPMPMPMHKPMSMHKPMPMHMHKPMPMPMAIFRGKYSSQKKILFFHKII